MGNANPRTAKPGDLCGAVFFDLEDERRLDLFLGDDFSAVAAMMFEAINAGTGDDGGWAIGVLNQESAQLANAFQSEPEEMVDGERVNRLFELLWQDGLRAVPTEEEAELRTTSFSVYEEI